MKTESNYRITAVKVYFNGCQPDTEDTDIVTDDLEGTRRTFHEKYRKKYMRELKRRDGEEYELYIDFNHRRLWK